MKRQLERQMAMMEFAVARVHLVHIGDQASLFKEHVSARRVVHSGPCRRISKMPQRASVGPNQATAPTDPGNGHVP